MKIRIHENSIRFRLNRIEVASFAVSGRVDSVIHFPGGALRFALESDAQVSTRSGLCRGDDPHPGAPRHRDGMGGG